MAKKKTTASSAKRPSPGQAYIENAGVVVEQQITDTLIQNYMPYAMSVIVSRAIPEIDGFKPSHRKILYTMYTMGLLKGGRVKSANAVGEVMKLHPHGDQAIYDTLVRMARGNESLLHPYIDSKGNFGKSYSRDMAYAAPRYTEVKLMPICAELFSDIDKDTVDMVDNYDGTRKEPALLPVTFPSILVNSNVGIAVGMASAICPFNLSEVCETAIALIQDPDADIFETLRAPDFPVGGQILYDEAEMHRVLETGRGSVRVRSRYRYDPENHCIEITEIPPTTTVEAIIDKLVELVKSGKVRELADVRDETDLGGLKLTLDLKRGVDADKLMRRLFKLTTLEDTFSCNFNVLVGAVPRVMGVREILQEWTAFRTECVRRRIYFELSKKKDKLHLLEGLSKILLDIDKAIAIVRETEEEREVVPNLMIGFGIDQTQAEYVAEIRLRQLNREYILNRTKEIGDLEADIAEMESILKSRTKLLGVIIKELRTVIKTYGQPRRSEILYTYEEGEDAEAKETPDYPVLLFFTREGYFKKITPQSWRMSSEHKLKEGDAVSQTFETTNSAQLLFFTNHAQVYKSSAAEFDDTKASVLGEYVAARLGMEEGEVPVYLAVTSDYRGMMLFAFENGKVAKVELSSYETKTRRKKLTGAFSDKSPLVGALCLTEDAKFWLEASNGRVMIVDSARIASKSARDTQGVQVFTLRGAHRVTKFSLYQEGSIGSEHRYLLRTMPGAGYTLREEDGLEQTTL